MCLWYGPWLIPLLRYWRIEDENMQLNIVLVMLMCLGNVNILSMALYTVSHAYHTNGSVRCLFAPFSCFHRSKQCGFTT